MFQLLFFLICVNLIFKIYILPETVGLEGLMTVTNQIELELLKSIWCHITLGEKSMWVLGCVECAIFWAVWIMGSVIQGCVVGGLGGLEAFHLMKN
jgi:hypothetical protein